MAASSLGVEALVRDFTARVIEAVQVQARERVLSAVASAFAASPRPSSASHLARRKPARSIAQKARRAPKLSAKTLAVRRLQGRYLGALRGLPPAARAQVKRMAHEKGVAAAVELAMSLR
jgi:hypothetical protein